MALNAHLLQTRIAFLIGADKARAVAWATRRGWARIALWRFTNEEREDVRVIDALQDFRSFGSGTRLYRADGWRGRPDTEKWQALVDAGAARWGNRLEPAPEGGEGK